MNANDIYLLIMKDKDDFWTAFYAHLNESGKIQQDVSNSIKKTGTSNYGYLVNENVNIASGLKQLLFASKIPYDIWAKRFTLNNDFAYKRLKELFSGVISPQILVEHFQNRGINVYSLDKYVETLDIPAPIKYKILNVPSSFDNQILFKEAPISVC